MGLKEHDTHCSQCGAALKPVPVLTTFAWECSCGGQSILQRGINPDPNKGLLGYLVDTFGYGRMFRHLSSPNGVSVHKKVVRPHGRRKNMILVDIYETDGTLWASNWELPEAGSDVFELLN